MWASPLFFIGDLHADVQAARRILIGLKLIDKQDRWIGGSSQLVTLGDHLDRGPESRALLDLLLKLEKESFVSGGRVVNILGNHEYITVDGHYTFANVNDNFHYRDFKMGPRGSGYERAFVGDTKYAQWFRSRPAIELVGETLFVHAGLSERMLDYSISQINELVQSWFRFQQGAGPEPDSATQWVVQNEGPLWTRALSYRSDTLIAGVNKLRLSSAVLDKLLQHFKAKRVVIGHSMVDNLNAAVDHPFYGDRVVMTDTGISIADKGLVTGFKVESDIVTVYEFDRNVGQLLRTIRSSKRSCAKFYSR